MNSIRTTVATLLVGALTYAGAVVPSYAADPDPAPVLPPTAQAAEHAAEQALAHAEAVLSGEVAGADATLALVDLYNALPDLDRTDRKAARQLLARPDGTAPTNLSEPKYGALTPVYAACGAHVCVHFVKTGQHAVAPADTTGVIGIPDWVELNLAYLEHAWTVEIDGLTYRKPRPDLDRGESKATALAGSLDNKIDIYLAQLPDGYFGYAQPETDPDDGNARTTTAHMVIDVDMADLGCASTAVCVQATAAHEFFHVVQFAYDVDEAGWMMESTATWVEEKVFDAANDNRNYLPFGSLRKPQQPLDSADGLAEYGNWIFWEHLARRKGAKIVLDFWRRANFAGYDGLTALSRALYDNGTNLPTMFSSFSGASNIPALSYEEGSVYPRAEVAATWSFSQAARSTSWRSTSLPHLASRNFVFVPSGGLSATGWRLKLDINGPSGSATTAYVLVHYKSGAVGRYAIALNGYGNATRHFDFSSSRIAKVTANFGNAGATDGRVTQFRGVAVIG